VAQSNGVLAIEHYMNTLRCTERTNDLIFRSASHFHHGTGYYYLNDLDSALKSVYDGRRIAEDLGIDSSIVRLLRGELICFAQNNMEKALMPLRQRCGWRVKIRNRCMKHSPCSAWEG